VIRFLIDEQLPPALADHLIGEGYSAEHVNALGGGPPADIEIWLEAIARRAVIISKDQDFVSLVQSDPTGPQVVWIRLGNVTNTALWGSLKPLLREITAALEAGERLIEIR
jgi:predicted nuclease of predicted toxin-antitoxin system